MDISYWIQFNPKIGVEHTVKKYFGRYLYKLVLYVPAGRLIHSKCNIEEELQYRKNFNHGGSWRYRQITNDAHNADVKFLETMREVKHDKSLQIKLRVEEPRIQIYADNEQELKNLIKTHISNYTSHIETISGPEDAEAESILNAGAIIKKNDIGYRFKVILKDGRYDIATKQQILHYLQNMGEEMVGVTRGTCEMLSKPTSFMWNCYFYSNDPKIDVFLNLISPGIISNCHELVVKAHK